jgi:hypothetical protein
MVWRKVSDGAPPGSKRYVRWIELKVLLKLPRLETDVSQQNAYQEPP